MKQELEKELEFLLLNKSFTDLTGQEREYALGHLTEDEYKRYHLLLDNYSSSEVTGPSIAPDPAIEKELLNVFRSKNRQPFFKFKWLNPLSGEFSPALTFSAFALLIFAYFLMPLQVDKQNKINKPQTRYSGGIPDEFPPDVISVRGNSGEEPLCLTTELEPLGLTTGNDNTAVGLTTELSLPHPEFR